MDDSSVWRKSQILGNTRGKRLDPLKKALCNKAVLACATTPLGERNFTPLQMFKYKLLIKQKNSIEGHPGIMKRLT